MAYVSDDEADVGTDIPHSSGKLGREASNDSEIHQVDRYRWLSSLYPQQAAKAHVWEATLHTANQDSLNQRNS